MFYSGQWQAQSAYTYDNASRLARASLPLANVSATYSRDIANSPLLSALTFREGGETRLTTTRDYDLLDRLTSIASVPSASSVVSFANAFDLLNQRTGLTNADNPFTISKPWVTPCYFFCFLESCAGGEREPASHNTAKIHQAPDGISLVIRIATKA